METPEEITQAHMAVSKTEAGKTLSWDEKDQVAQSIVSGKVGNLKAPQAREALVEALISLGVTSEFLGRKLREGLEAEETVFAQSGGQITDRARKENWYARLGYMRAALKVFGAEGGSRSPKMAVKNFIYKPMLRGGGETITVDAPKESILKRRMAAAKHTARPVPEDS
jgi:hypothetical protein